MKKIEREILDEVLKWSKWKEREVDYWLKDTNYIAKEIKLWQKKLKEKQKK